MKRRKVAAYNFLLIGLLAAVVLTALVVSPGRASGQRTGQPLANFDLGPTDMAVVTGQILDGAVEDLLFFPPAGQDPLLLLLDGVGIQYTRLPFFIVGQVVDAAACNDPATRSVWGNFYLSTDAVLISVLARITGQPIGSWVAFIPYQENCVEGDGVIVITENEASVSEQDQLRAEPVPLNYGSSESTWAARDELFRFFIYATTGGLPHQR